MSSEKLNFAIAAIKSGDKVTGLHLLAEIIKAEPSNEYAWIWLTTCVDDNEKKIFCLKRAFINQFQIDPVVNKALAQLVQPPLPAKKNSFLIIHKKKISPQKSHCRLIFPKKISPPNGQITVTYESEITLSLRSSIKPQKAFQFELIFFQRSQKKKRKYYAFIGGSIIVFIYILFLLVLYVSSNSPHP